MKLGILTFLHTTNYGAVLQAYAMQSLLSDMGVSSEFIDYYSPEVLKNHDPKQLKHRKGLGNKLILPFAYRVYKKRLDKFSEFETRYLSLSKRRYDRASISQSTNEYDRFLVGSDQVWNPTVTGGDLSFFLDFLSDKSKKLSFAASVGSADIPSPYREECYELLRGFARVNVREASAADRLRSAGIDAETVLDPTLLLGREHWMRFVGERPHGKKYILVYMPPNNESLKKALAYAKNRGYDVFLVKKGVKPTVGVKLLNVLSPADFLNWLYHADAVMCGSFHGVCFSVLFEKRFWAFPSRFGERTERIDGLLCELGLSERKCGVGTDICGGGIDFSEARARLSELREASVGILKQTVGK